MKYIDCLIMNAGLAAVSASGMKARFSYKVARNKRLIEPIIKSLDEMVKPSDDHKKFIDARQELLKEYAEKDDNGNPVMRTKWVGAQQRESYIIPDINDKGNEFNTKLKVLKKKYEKEINEQDEKEKDYEKHLEEECDDFTPFMVEWKLVPESGLSQEAMDGVQYMIKQSDEEPEQKKRKKAVKPEPK